MILFSDIRTYSAYLRRSIIAVVSRASRKKNVAFYVVGTNISFVHAHTYVHISLPGTQTQP